MNKRVVMSIDKANSIIQKLIIQSSLDVKDSPSIVEDNSKLTEVFSQLKGVIENSQSSRDVSVFKENLKTLELALLYTKDSSQISTVSKLVSTASDHLKVLTTDYQEKRDEALGRIPDTKVSLRGVDPDAIKGKSSCLEILIEWCYTYSTITRSC